MEVLSRVDGQNTNKNKRHRHCLSCITPSCERRYRRDAAMDLIFHGPLGMELSLIEAPACAGQGRGADSPALLVVGRADGDRGVPVGEIRDKKSWLAVVAKLQAPERPLSLWFEAPPEGTRSPRRTRGRASRSRNGVAEHGTYRGAVPARSGRVTKDYRRRRD